MVKHCVSSNIVYIELMKRQYNLKDRADSQARTRQKIINATMQLHQQKGLLATTVEDIAKRAKVGKVTVYRHFPGDTELVTACSGQYFHLNPFPDLQSWSAIKDPEKRIIKALNETFDFHQTTEPMMYGILSEARNHPVVAPYHAYWDRAAKLLASGYPKANKILRAKISLALSFDNWYLLVKKQKLSKSEVLKIYYELLGIAK